MGSENEATLRRILGKTWNSLSFVRRAALIRALDEAEARGLERAARLCDDKAWELKRQREEMGNGPTSPFMAEWQQLFNAAKRIRALPPTPSEETKR